MADAPALLPMTVHDLDRVTAIEAHAYSHPWRREHFVDSLAAGHEARVLIVPGTGLSGYCVCSAGVDEWHLLNLTVAREHWRRGWGSLLLRAVVDIARAQGKTAVWLEVRASNTAAQALYHRHGFVSNGIRRQYYPDVTGREDAVLMTLTLPTLGVTA